MLKNLRKTSVFIVIIMVLVGQLPAAADISETFTAKVGFVGAQFLKIGVGARGFAMGDAMETIADDASAVFWNPAGLTLAQGRTAFIAQTAWLADIEHTALAFAMPLSRLPGNVAFSAVSLNSPDMLVTSVEDQEGDLGQTFNAVNYAIGIGYGIKLTDKFSFGAHWKIIHENYANGLGEADGYGTGTTWAVDVGTLFLTGYKSLRLGMSIRNFGPEMQLGGTYIDYDEGDTITTTEEEPDPSGTGYVQVEVPDELPFKPHSLPLTFRFGMSADPIDKPTMKLTLSVVGEHPPDNAERLNLGAELTFLKFFVGRAGYVMNHDSRKALSFGFGLDSFPVAGVGRLSADFGLTQFDLFDPTWMASVGFQF
ncbi:MAG: PorV/PorQ family protein [Fidelibacterota bacterium]